MIKLSRTDLLWGYISVSIDNELPWVVMRSILDPVDSIIKYSLNYIIEDGTSYPRDARGRAY